MAKKITFAPAAVDVKKKTAKEYEEEQKKAAAAAILAGATKSALAAGIDAKKKKAAARSASMPNATSMQKTSTAAPVATVPTRAQATSNARYGVEEYNNAYHTMLDQMLKYAKYGPSAVKDLANSLQSDEMIDMSERGFRNWNDDTAAAALLGQGELAEYFRENGYFDTSDYLNREYITMPSTGYLKQQMPGVQKAVEESLAKDEQNKLYQSNLESTMRGWEQLEAEKNNPHTFDPMYGYAMMEYLQGDREEPFNYDQWDYEYQLLDDAKKKERLADLEKQWNSLDFDTLTGRNYKYESKTNEYQNQLDTIEKELERRSQYEAISSELRNSPYYGVPYVVPEEDKARAIMPGLGGELMLTQIDTNSYNLQYLINHGMDTNLGSQIENGNPVVKNYLDNGLFLMEEDEKYEYNAAVALGREKEYLEIKLPELRYRKARYDAQYLGAMATDPVVGPIMSVATVPMNIWGAGMTAIGAATGEDDPYAPIYSTSRTVNTYRGKRGEVWGEMLPFEILGEKAGNLLYNIGMSTADMVAAQKFSSAMAGIFGKADAAKSIMGTVMATEVGTGTFLDDLESGRGYEYAVLHGFTDSMISTVAESGFLDNLFSPDGKLAMRTLKSAVSEGGEELFEEGGQMMSDAFFSYLTGQESQIKEIYNYYVDTLGKDQAAIATLKDLGNRFAIAGLSGFAMGGGTAAVYNAGQYADNRKSGKEIRNTGDPEAIMNIALGMDESSESNKIAKDVQAHVDKGKPITNYELGQLTGALARDLDAERASIVDRVQDDAIVNRLVELDVNTSDAKKLAPVIRKLYRGGKLTMAEKTAVPWNDQATQVVKELSRETKADDGQRAGNKWVSSMKANQIEATGAVTGKQIALISSTTTKNVSKTAQDAAAKGEAKVRKGKDGKTAGKPTARKVAFDDGTARGEGDLLRFEEQDGELKMVIQTENKGGEGKAQKAEQAVSLDSLTEADGAGTAGIIEAVNDINKNLHPVTAEEANTLLGAYGASGGDVARFVDNYERAYLSGYSGTETQQVQLDPQLLKMARESGARQAEKDEATRKQRASDYKALVKPVAAWLGKVKDNSQVQGTGDTEALAGALEAMTEAQRTTAEVCVNLGKATGLNVVLFESDADNVNEIQNGSFDAATHTVYLDINSGAGSAQDIEAQRSSGTLGAAMVRTMSHELTHYLEVASPEMYAKYKAAVRAGLKAAGKNADLAVLIREKIDRALNEGRKLTYGAAEAEVIADASEYMLQDSKFTNNLDSSLKGKIKAFVQNFAQKVKDAFEQLTGGHRESRALRELADGVYHYTKNLQELWDASLQEILGKDITHQQSDHAGEETDEESPVGKRALGKHAAQEEEGEYKPYYGKHRAKEIPVEELEAEPEFTMQADVEVRDDNLMATHNISEQNLRATLALGAFPMPSIAIQRATDNWNVAYGDYTIIFGKETIDPEANVNNRVYGEDAYTPRFPKEYVENNPNASTSEIVEIMKQDKESMGYAPVEKGGSKRYKSIKEIKENAHRLGRQPEEYYEKKRKLDAALWELLSMTYEVETVEDFERATEKVKKAVRDGDRTEIDKVIDEVTTEAGKNRAKFLVGLIDEMVKDIPAFYFEAKPARVVGFDEIKMLVAPATMPEDLATALDERGIPYTTYDGSITDRIAKSNAVPGVRFSQRDGSLLDGSEYSTRDGIIDYDDANSDDFHKDGRIYDYDFMVRQKPAKVVVIPSVDNLMKNGRFSRSEVVESGKTGIVGPANEKGHKVVENVYTGRALTITNNSIRHGLNGNKQRLLANAQIGMVIGDVVKNGIPVNGLMPTDENAMQTYAMVTPCVTEDGKRMMAVTHVDIQKNEVSSVTFTDIVHSANGRIYKNSEPVSDTIDVEGEIPYHPSRYTISISDLLKDVNISFKSLLSEDVLEHLGEERPQNGAYSDKVLYSTSDLPADITVREFVTGAGDDAASTVEEKNALKIYRGKMEAYREATNEVEAAETALKAVRSMARDAEHEGTTDTKTKGAIKAEWVPKVEGAQRRVDTARVKQRQAYNKLVAIEETPHVQSVFGWARQFLTESLAGTPEEIEARRVETDKLLHEMETQYESLKAAGRTQAASESKRRAELYQRMSKAFRSDAAKALQDAKAQYREREQKAREYRRARDEVAKMRRKIGRKVKRLNNLRVNETDQKHVPQELKHLADEVMRVFTDSGLSSLAFSAKRTANLRRTYSILAELQEDWAYYWDDELEKMIDDLAKLSEQYGAIKDKETEASRFTLEGKELEMEILQNVDNIVSGVMNMIDSTNEDFLNERKETFNQFANKAGEKMRTRDDYKVRKGWQGRVQTMLDETIRTGNVTPIYFFEHLENQEIQDVFNEIREGMHQAAMIEREGKEYIERVRANRNYGKWVADGRLTMKTSNGHTIELTREEAAEIYAIAKREKANKLYQTEHLLYGGFQYKHIDDHVDTDRKHLVKDTPHQLDAADLAKIENWLTDEQKAYADDLVEYLSTTMADYGNEASMEMYGYNKFTEQYYIPFHTVPSQRFQKGDEGPQGENAGTGRMKNSSFTHKLQHGAKETLYVGGISETVADHIHRMAAYSAMVQPIENMKRLLNYKVLGNDGTSNTIRALIGQKYGKASEDYLTQLLKDLNGATQSDQRAAGFTDKLVSAFKRGAVMASASVVLQQPTAMARAMAMISPKYFAQNPFYRPSKGTWEKMMKYSGAAVIKDMGKFDVGMGKTASQYILDEDLNAVEAYRRLKTESKTKAGKAAYDRFMAWLTAAPGAADQWTWGLIWKAAEAEQAALHPEMDRNSEAFLQIVGQRFDDVVDHTQVYDSVLTKSNLMRSTNAMHKMATSFMSEPTLSLNMLYDALTGWKRKRHTGWHRGRIIGSVVASQVLAGAMAALVQAWNDDDDERNWLEKYTDRATGNILDNLNPLGMIPYISDIVSLFEGYDVERPDMSVIADVYSYGKTFFKSFEDGGSPTWKQIENFAGTLANLTGVPAKNISREIRRTWNAITKTDWSAPSGFGVGQAIMENVPGYSDKNKAYYQRIVTAEMRGDAEFAEDLRNYMLTSKMVKEDSMTEGIRSAYKERYEEGGIEKDDAIRFLLDHDLVTGDDEEERKKNAFQYVDRWEEGSTNYSAYNTLKAAYGAINYNDIQKAWKELTDNGYTDKQVKEQSRQLLKKLVQEGTINTYQATELLRKWCSYAKDSDNVEKPKEWQKNK